MNTPAFNMSALLKMLGDAYIILNREGIIIDHAAENYLIRAFLGAPIRIGNSISHEAEESRTSFLNDIITRVIHTGLPVKTEMERSDPFKGLLCLKVHAEFIPAEKGYPDFIYILLQDITTQKVYQRKFTDQARDINHLLETANAIVMGIDAQGYITDWNAFSEVTTGFSKAEAMAHPFIDFLISESDRDHFIARCQRVTEDKQTFKLEIPIRKKDGKIATVLLSGVPRLTPIGHVVGTFFIGQDITDVVAYQNSLEQKVEERTHELYQALRKERDLVEMKNRFVSVASHEFRTPLSSIKTATRYVKHHLPKQADPAIQSRLEDIEKKITFMTALLDDVLTMDKNEAGKIQLKTQSIPLITFLQTLAEEVQLTTKNSHTIICDLKTLPPAWTTDEKLLRNIFINLLTNAIKYSPGKSAVSFSGWTNETLGITISVKDHGLGIAAEDLTLIFEPFLRSSSVNHIEGTGLGLSIVKRAVDLLKGNIEVKSTLGAGSEFQVHLPLLN